MGEKRAKLEKKVQNTAPCNDENIFFQSFLEKLFSAFLKIVIIHVSVAVVNSHVEPPHPALPSCQINCDSIKEIKPNIVQFAAETSANFFKCLH